MRGTTRRTTMGVLTVVVGLVLIAWPTPAHADPNLTGCAGSVISLDAEGEAITEVRGEPPHDVVTAGDDESAFSQGSPFVVDPDGGVEWTGSSTVTITDQSWSLSVWGVDLLSGSGQNADGADFAAGTLAVDDAVPLGLVGLFRVEGTLTGDGGRCDAAGWVEVRGSPLFSPPWFAALALLAAGAMLLLVAQPKQVAREDP